MPARPDPLDAVLVIDELDVGPVELAPRRLRMPYAVVSGGKREATELHYRWEEVVFAPEDPDARNLASLIGVQVALNYGLFCRRIVLRGPFDAVDRRFLADALENTSREIYVKKLLEPNPFLEGPATALKPERRERYARAELAFADRREREIGGAASTHELEDATDEPPPRSAAWVADRRRHAVLSSGGKDSLLTLGLLEEAGVEVHSVFVNESGRHWYTALNAYRHLERTRPALTARVWTTSDRLFAWMLRHLPFVRRDFARVRSDEYPIRLWTVAVFLFGALPVLRRRGIGRLVIGDEFDTSRRLRREGVSHYDGLYDQSRWFDDALSRFYARKGWPLAQFSLLRPASELLVQKTLVERYPELQRHQVSCHAASIRGERVFPCGRCEKCRRIVGMLVALDADPGGCGYGEEEARACLRALARDGVHQEAAGAEQLAWMLASRGLLPDAASGHARERPEVLRLRFHEEAAPVDGIPVDLRRPVWGALLEHAEGAVRRDGKRWERFEPLAAETLRRPYRFEGPTGGSGGTRRAGRAAAESTDATTAGEPEPEAPDYLLATLTWPRAAERLRETDVALLPVGAIEQHGPHLPLDVDAWDAEHLCREVARRCRSPRPLVLPLIPYRVSYHQADFPGTLSVGPDTLSRLVYEVGVSTARHGIRKLVIVNGHGGNARALQFAAQLINRDAKIFSCVDTGESSDADVEALVETSDDAHAGEIETSTALATRPELVELDEAVARTPLMVEHLVRFVEALAEMRLDQIHEKEL